MASTSASKKISVKKNRKEDAKRCRKWTEDELEQFAVVLSDEENYFALNLEKLALKKSSNDEVFSHIKKFFDTILHDQSFREQNNQNNFVLKDGTAMKYVNIDTSVEKLRRKYANLKTKWRKLRDRVKNGSGLSPKNEPRWYKYMNPIFSEKNEDVDLTVEPADVSCMDDLVENQGNENFPESDYSNFSDDENNNFSKALSLKAKSLKKKLSSTPTVSESEEEHANEEEAKRFKTGKVVAAPHQKRKTVRSQQQALSQLVSSVDQIASVQMKKHKMTLESDLKREKMYLKFKQEEMQRNREHEERMAARTREHEINMAEIHLRANSSSNSNQGDNFFLPASTNMRSMNTPLQHNAMAATNFTRCSTAPLSTAPISSPARYEL